jgi:hypothetical protein
MTKEIELLKQEIKMLQSKLEFLEELDRVKSPAEEAFKRVYCRYPDKLDDKYGSAWDIFEKGYARAQKDYKVGEYEPTPQTPEETAEGLRNAMIQAKKDGVFDEPSKPMNEVMDRLENKYKDAEENAASYMTDEVIDRMVKKYQAQKLWNRVRDELGYSIDCCDSIVDLVEKWLPDPQSAAGSQSVDTELLVDGFNDCVRKMKEMLR